MLVTKPLDLALLEQELATAGVAVNGLGTYPVDGGDELHTFAADGSGAIVDVPAEAAPVVDAHDGTKQARTAAFETAEDAERLRIVAERAADDPAFAALADLTLRGKA